MQMTRCRDRALVSSILAWANSKPTACPGSWRSRCAARVTGYPTFEPVSSRSGSTTSTWPSSRNAPTTEFYGVGLINWWDGEGAERTLAELVSLGIKTFWLPLKAGKDEEGNPIDYNSKHITPVWEAIEAAGLPVSHHIGEGMISAPCAKNGYAVSMVHNAAPFREMFGRYVCTGLLDRHKGLKVGWFEGGINWVPSAIQDAEHMYTSYLHTSNVELEQAPQYYWDTHMYVSFMIDPLGLDLIDRIGRDKVMWSTDFPHIESTFGYSEKSLTSVVEKLGPRSTPCAR